MRFIDAPRVAAVIATVLVTFVAPAAASAAAQETPEVAVASASWHGRAIQDPKPRPQLRQVSWPAGWSARSVGFGTGYASADGSKRVKDLQRRLLQLGYRPGPVDGLFGPRTRAATRWFQYKHGLRLTGRANRATLTILRARSDHEPLPTTDRTASGGTQSPDQTAGGTATTESEERAIRSSVPAAADTDSGLPLWLLLIALLLALMLGILVGGVVPAVRRRPAASTPTATPAPAAAVAAPVPTAPAPPRVAALRAPVLGYVTVRPNGGDADTATPALANVCARRGWSLIKIVHDPRPASGRLADRPGLMYALKEIRDGAASGLVVAHLRDFTADFGDLAALTKYLYDAEGFLAAADHELDTSTRAGRATAEAIIAIGGWERRRLAQSGRFTPAREGDLGPDLAALRERGIPLRAIADALTLARVRTPSGRTQWQPATVKAAVEEQHRAHE